MKKVIFTLTMLVSVANCFCQNLIQNPSFEDGQQSWGNYATDGAKAIFSVENNTSSNLKIEVQQLGTNPWDIQSLQSFASQQGKAYTFKIKAKAKNEGSKIRVQVQNTTYTSIDLELTSALKEYTWDFVAKEDNLELALQYFEIDTFYIDYIEIIESVRATGKVKNLISNGNLEKGTEGWINLADNGANVVYTINEDSPFEGEKSLRALVLLLGDNTWDIQSINNFPSVRGTRYELTFMAKADSNGKKIKAQVQHNDKKIYVPKDFVLTDEWKAYSWSFRAATENMQIALQYLNLGLYEIDELSIVEVVKKKKKKKKKKKS
ncbi:carbohydrate binding domain-containing protein [uncultured Winogradskyella sp.]|uniref:carbohydrate binding domain-containing protein n=1 Tax=uncultured Winogradskyella sp. TaxID=395353 RepID=UPI002614EDA4|nr:carbohydrate binding domain-containing protein [uncultured Winogradskyella sp.]